MTQVERPKRFDRIVDGILLLDKAVGLSSNAALQQVRRQFRAIKAGHAGSLDPLASGMLPVCFGQATKVCGLLLDSDKTYRVRARLGQQTDTGDTEGNIVAEQAQPQLDEAFIVRTLGGFLGTQQQVPPMYSALKHEGQRLYALARRGEQIERQPRAIRISRLALLGHSGSELELEVECSKGTYIRVLVEDIARALGTLGHVGALRRTEIGAFAGESMHSWGEIAAIEDLGQLSALLLPIDRVFLRLPAVRLNGAGETDFLHGRPTRELAEDSPENGSSALRRAYAAETGRFLGLVESLPDGTYKPERLFVPAAGL